MEDGNSSSSGGGKSAGGRTKTPGISTSTRLQRNQAEKERRDKLNGFISELATLVPMVSNASKPLDKVSILRLAAAEMRLHFSCLNPKKYKNKPLMLPPAIMASLDIIEKTIGGFIIVTTLTGVIVFCSRSIEDYLGYQNIDVMGNKVVKYIYEDDIKYFEAKVNSVVNSLKKASKKKTKVIKAHMLQKPLPRSNESCRPRNMIFKLSVHKNDINDNNGRESSTETSILKKTRGQKDYGYTAVVLMFIEPVRLEPEIDITYIDSNQDVYFTRHGLQGEIIYADQRISSITGYMPHDVQGTSAYQYICSSDVPIALFAQKAMFTSNDGKGDIVYRLRIRDMRFIYLQSSGQIAYKESSNEISHFVCFNRLLSEEEGSQELKKFQQRFAPQIMAAKMLQVKQINNPNQSQITDLTLEQPMTLVNSPGTMIDTTSPVTQISSLLCSKSSSPKVDMGASDQMLSSDSFVSPSISSTGTSSVHSSEGHSMTSPLSRSSSITSEYSGYTSEHMDFVVLKHEQTSPLKNDSFINGTCESMICKENPENGVNGLDNNLLVIGKSCHTENVVRTNGTHRIKRNGPCVDMKPQVMHSVNAFSTNLQNRISVTNSPGETVCDNPMDFDFDHMVRQKESVLECNLVPENLNMYVDKSIGLMPVSKNGGQNGYGMYNGQAKEKQHRISLQNNLQLPMAHHSKARDQQQLNRNGEQIPQSRLQQHDPQNLFSFSEVYEISPASSLPKASVSDLGDTTVSYCPDVTSYHMNGESYLPTSVGGYNNGANETVAFDAAANPKTFGSVVAPHDLNGYHVAVSSVDVLASFPAVTDSSFESMDTSSLSPDRTELFDFVAKPPMSDYGNGGCDPYSNVVCGSDSVMAPANWTTGAQPPADLALNKELYEELDLFFQNLPQSSPPQSSGTLVPSEIPVDGGSYQQQNSISSYRAKRNYPQ